MVSNYLPRCYPFGPGWSLNYCQSEIAEYCNLNKTYLTFNKCTAENYQLLIASRIEEKAKKIFNAASSKASGLNYSIVLPDPAEEDEDKINYRKIFQGLFSNLQDLINESYPNKFEANFIEDNHQYTLHLSWNNTPESCKAIMDFSTMLRVGDKPAVENRGLPPEDDNCIIM